MLFEYMDFRDWWATNAGMVGTKSDDVVGGVYEAKKIDKKGRPTRFLNSTVRSAYKLNIRIGDDEDAPMGVSDVYVAQTERKAPFWMFFVYPAVKLDTRGKQLDYPLADHLSFCLDASDERRPNHFHSTEYGVFMTGAKPVHTKNFMPDPVEIPATGTRTRMLDKQPAWVKSLALTVMRMPFAMGGQEGASGRGTTASGTIRRRPRVEALREELYDILRNREITRVTWFGVRHARRWHYSIDVVDNETRHPEEVEDGLHFVLRSSDEVDVLQKLVDVFGDQS